MEIELNIPRFWRASWEIAINGQLRFVSTKRFLTLSKREIIIKDTDESELARIQQKWSWFYPRYSIWLTAGELYIFETKCSLWERKFCCANSKEVLEILEHNKRRFSVFRGQRQIAAFWKDVFTLFGQYRFRMVAEDDENALLLAAVVLLCHSTIRYYDEGDGGLLEIDLRFAAERQPFNTAWVEEQRKKNTLQQSRS